MSLIDRVATIMAEVAEEEVLPRFRALEAHEIREKRPGDVVTVADEAAEHALSRRLPDLLAGSLVVGEEAVSRDREVIKRLRGEEPVWVIDPIDGTHNFAKGHAEFAVMVALVRGGTTLAGWIYDPTTRRLAAGERGGGVVFDGRPARLAPPAPPAAMGGRFFAGWRSASPDVKALASRAAALGATHMLYSAAHEYLKLLAGAWHFGVYWLNVNPWDHAAGQMMHAELGGHSAALDGAPYTPIRSRGGLVLAPDEASWRALCAVLFPDGPPQVLIERPGTE